MFSENQKNAALTQYALIKATLCMYGLNNLHGQFLRFQFLISLFIGIDCS